MSWQKVKLGEIADCSLGKMLDHKKNVGELHPYLANFNVQWGRIDLSEVGEMPFKPEELKRYKLEKGDLLVCEGGESGRCAMWNGQVKDMMYQKALHRLRVKSGLCSSGYLYFWFLCNGKSDYFRQFTTGATILHLPLQNLVEISVSLPPLPIQRKIADVLGAYDELIENNSKRIALLEKMARELYRERFVRRRGVRSQWKRVKLGDVISFVRGVGYGSRDIISGDNVLLSMNNVRPFGGFVRDYGRRYSGRFKEVQRVNGGDLIMSITDMTQDRRIIGYTGIVPPGNDNRIICTHLMKLKSDACHSYFLNGLFNYSNLSRIVSEHATGATVLGLTADVLREIPCDLPPREEQCKYVECVKPIVDMIFKLEDCSEILARQRDRLLPRLMSGKIDVEKLVMEGK